MSRVEVEIQIDAPIDEVDLERRLKGRDDRQEAIIDDEAKRFIGRAAVLTDDFAPVDQLLGSR